MRGRSKSNWFLATSRLLASFVFAFVMCCFTCVTVFADDRQPVTSITINLENPVNNTPQLPSISSYGTGYYYDSCYWIDSTVKPGAIRNVEITVKASNGYMFSNPSVNVYGGEYISTNYCDSDKIIITIKSSPIRIAYPEVSSARWDSDTWGRATWKRSEYGDCKYEISYNGKTYTTSKTYYNLSSKIKNWSDTDDYFEVRVIPKNDDIAKYAYPSEYVRSNDLDWDDEDFSYDDYENYPDYPYNCSSYWEQSHSFWYYYRNGHKVKDDWVFDNNSWYFMNDNGKMVTGKQTINGKYYFFRYSGEMVSNDWMQINNKFYFFYVDGSMALDTWIQSNGLWYYLGNEGAMLTDRWIGPYYVGSDGAMCTNTWIGKYYVGPDGHYVK